MPSNTDAIIYRFKDINRILLQEFISTKSSFEICEFNDIRDMSVTVEAIERIIEKQGLIYRVYDDTPQAAMILDPYISLQPSSGFFGLIRTIIKITIDNKFSGYRLGKSFNTLSVIWQQ
ncbi:hypothetical protein CB172_13150 [Salmonella enterica subsp. enterica serovar Claibornei]|nr:hypothetical protein [Salmonella enterica subsp. enterica serovar Claibornei]